MKTKLKAWRDFAICLAVLGALIAAHQKFPLIDLSLRLALVLFAVVASCALLWTGFRSGHAKPADLWTRWQRWAQGEDGGDGNDPR